METGIKMPETIEGEVEWLSVATVAPVLVVLA
jgi:hypothetical protein